MPLVQALIAASFAALASAKWQAVYYSNMSGAYIQLANEKLISLNVTAAQNGNGETFLNAITTLKAPPTNSSLVLDADNQLYAVGGGSATCRRDPLVVYAYDGSNWQVLAQSPEDWALDASTVWYDESTNAIMVYGGACGDQIYSSFHQYSLGTGKFSNVTSAVTPREMAYAQSLRLSKTSTVIVGGRASSGWMSMQQLAFWEYGSWTYRTIANSTGIDSRDFPLLLPMWNSTTAQVSRVLIIGGTVDGRASAPLLASLEFDDKGGWLWCDASPELASGIPSIYATLFESLVVVNSASTNAQKSASSSAAKGENSGTPSSANINSVEIYDSNANWRQVKRVNAPSAVPLAAASASPNNISASRSSPIASIAAMGTILPVVVLTASGLGIWLWLRRRRQRRTFLPRQGPFSPSILSISGTDYSLPEPKLPPPVASINTKASIGSLTTTLNPCGTETEDPFDDCRDLGALQDRRRTLHIANPDEDTEPEASHLSDAVISRSPSSRGAGAIGTGLVAGHRRTLSRRAPGSTSSEHYL